MLYKTTKFLSISLVAQKERILSLFCLIFVVVSDSFQPVPALYDFFRVIPMFTSDHAKECFDLQIYFKSTSARFYDKVGQALLQSETTLMYLLQIKASAITK